VDSRRIGIWGWVRAIMIYKFEFNGLLLIGHCVHAV